MSWSLRLDDFAWHILPKSDIADLVRDNLMLMTYWLHWDLLLLNWWLLAQIYRHWNVCQRVCSDYGRRQFKIIQSAMWIKSKTLKSSRWTPNQKRRIIDIIDKIVIEVREVNWVTHFLSPYSVLRCVLRCVLRSVKHRALFFCCGCLSKSLFSRSLSPTRPSERNVRRVK